MDELFGIRREVGGFGRICRWYDDELVNSRVGYYLVHINMPVDPVNEFSWSSASAI